MQLHDTHLQDIHFLNLRSNFRCELAPFVLHLTALYILLFDSLGLDSNHGLMNG